MKALSVNRCKSLSELRLGLYQEHLGYTCQTKRPFSITIFTLNSGVTRGRRR